MSLSTDLLRLQAGEMQAAGALTDEEKQVVDGFRSGFESAMDDDFNTSGGIATVFDMVKYANLNLNKESNPVFIQKFDDLFVELCDILGLGYKREEVLLDSDIEALIEKRQEARKARDFASADKIRDDLLAKGILLEDTREGVRFKRV